LEKSLLCRAEAVKSHPCGGVKFKIQDSRFKIEYINKMRHPPKAQPTMGIYRLLKISSFSLSCHRPH
jgi:hypothetical protein